MLTKPAPMRDLAERLACDQSYITNLADQVEDRGLVCRVPGDDRRVKLLQLTPAGEKLRDEISEAVAERGPWSYARSRQPNARPSPSRKPLRDDPTSDESRPGRPGVQWRAGSQGWFG